MKSKKKKPERINHDPHDPRRSIITLYGWRPIRKIIVAFLVGVIVYAGKRLGLDIGPEAAQEAVLTGLPILAGYLAR